MSLGLAKGADMPSKKQRALLAQSVEQRFPVGKCKGDTLAHTLTLGQSFRRINSLDFGSIRKSEALKPFSLN